MKKGNFWLCTAFLMMLAFAVMGSSCGGSSGDSVTLPNQTTTGRDSEVQAYVETLKSVGGLNSDETLPDSAVNYNAGTSAKSLSKSTATQVTQGESLSPVTLSLGFETDIWNVYVNNSLAASATSPGVSTGEFRPSANGVTISASSASSATISFSTSAMSAGSNVIAVALVPYASKPTQEIGRTTLGTVTVSSQSSTTSGDKTPTTSGDKTPDTTSKDTTPETTSGDKKSDETETGTDTDTDTDTETTADYSSTAANSNALSVTDGSTKSYSNITVTKTGDATGSSDGTSGYDWVGTNAAILASGGSKLTITGATITTNAVGGNAVFSYGGSRSGSGDGTTVTISDSKITTSKNNSGGIMTTGGGTMNASNLTITTAGGSSAAIRSDSGGGNVTVNGGTYTANGQGSPAIYSTAAITVADADLTSGIAQVVVIEGGNSVTLDTCKLTANHTSRNGQDSTYQAVLIYQSMSGDASDGASSFSMTDGSLTNTQGDIFCVTNTTTTINLSGVTITNNDSSGNFLRAEGQEWGTSGSNGGSVTLNASGQTMNGNMIVDSSSSLALNLKDSSAYSGAINTSGAAGAVNVTIESGSTWTLTGNSYVTSLTNNGTITQGSYTLYVNGTAYTE